MNQTWKETLRPLYFSEVARPVRNTLGRGLSALRMPRDVSNRIEAVLRRLPEEHAERLLPHVGKILEGVRRGSGLAPRAHWELFELLQSVPPRRLSLKQPPKKTSNRKRLRVLFVTGCFPSVNHGGGLRIFDIIRALSKEHEVSLFSHYEESSDRESLEKLTPSLASIRLLEGTEFSSEDFSSWAAARKPFDAAHFVWPHTSVLLPAAKHFARRTVFEMIECVTRRSAMDLERALASSPERVGRVFHELLKNWSMEAEGFRHADIPVALTPADSEFALEVFGGMPPMLSATGVSDYAVFDKLKGLPPAVSSGLELPPSAIFIGFYGHPPNIEGMAWYLENIHARIVEKVPGYRMIVAGVGNVAPLKKLAAGDPSVVFAGRVPELVPALREAKVCLTPLVSGAGIRLKINQYSAVGRPSVSTSIGVCGMPYVDGESVLVADDPAAFAEAVVKLLTDEVLYRKISQGAEKVVRENFTWEKILPDLVGLYG